MHIARLSTLSAHAFVEAVDHLLATGPVGSVLVLLAGNADLTTREWHEAITSAPNPFGGRFPMVFDDDAMVTDGGVVIGLEERVEIAVTRDIDGPSPAYEFPEIAGGSVATVFIFVDALASKLSTFLDATFEHFGLSVRSVGGGSGTLDFDGSPSVITPDGVIGDGAVMGLSTASWLAELAHGWKAIGEPLQVTAADGRMLVEIEGRPAGFRYVVALADLGVVQAPDMTFFDMAKSHPLGIARISDEVLVRDPMRCDDQGRIECAGAIEQGAFVRVLHGDAATLLDAARAVTDAVRTSYGSGLEPPVGLLFDCISRVLFLEDRFSEELRETRFGTRRLGAATIGEIFGSEHRGVELHNKAVVVAVPDLAQGPPA